MNKILITALLLTTLPITLKPIKSKSINLNSYTELSRKYKWMSKHLYKIIKLNADKNKLTPRLVSALINAESTGKYWAKGKPVRICIKSYRNRCFKRVWTRALGYMQIIPEFHYAKKPKHRLFTASVNIRIGTKFLAQCIKRGMGSVLIGLKNYNSGVRSSFYNWKYINNILRNS